jgi:hypothetical protein
MSSNNQAIYWVNHTIGKQHTQYQTLKLGSPSSGNTNRMGRLSTFDLLIKIGSLIKMKISS